MNTKTYIFVVIFAISIFLTSFLVGACTSNKNNTSNTEIKYTTDGLIQSVRKQDVSAIKKILKNGVNVNGNDNTGKTPLIFAITSLGNIETINILISNGANVNQTDKKLLSPLSYAVAYGYLDIVRILIENGANVNHVDSFKKTPLIESSTSMNLGIIQALIQAGADVNYITPQGINILLLASLNGIKREGNIKTVKYLLDNGADPTIIPPTEDGQTFSNAVESRGYPEITKMLKEAGLQ